MPQYLQYTLNWMAYYGGSDNPLDANSGNTTHYNIPLGCNANPAVPTACCNLTTNPTACFPAGVTGCGSSTDETASCYSSGVWSDTYHFKATNNDPGYTNLSGYAFLAGDADQLTAALKSAFGTIRDATYSFTQAAVQAVRTVDENFLYEASFQPVTYDPFWIGHMIRYTINTDGTINNTADWDAGTVLSGTSASDRNILTYTNGSLKSFVSGNLTNANLGAASDTERNAIINYFRGGETNGIVTNWKLGDVYHTSPMSIGTPNANFVDKLDKNDPPAFNTFRTDHIRSSVNGKRLIMVGANDGQVHAFKTGELGSGGGQELWSFIPPNLLSKLKTIVHSTHPTSLDHQYFVDGPLSASDIWLGSGTVGSTYKSSTDWYTYLVMSEGRGGIANLWSSSASCDSGFSPNYSSTYSNYCGYYAFDVTSSLSNPVYRWRLGGNIGLSTTIGSHLGQSWSKMFIGRVRINNAEKFVGLIGGGYSGTDCKGGGTCDPRGKGFYVVDMSNGSILWSYTHNGNNANMDYNLAAGPVAVDSDNDGFLDTAYVGDLGGNVWRFKFCKKSDNASCTTSDWTGGMLFQTASGNIRPIYNSVAVTIDDAYNLWVYSGTGDKTDPTAANAQEKFYAIKDNDRTTTYNLNNLDNIGATGVYADSPTKHGWYFNFSGSGEKVLGEPVIFEKRLYFTSYVPANGSNPCEQGGDAKLFVVDYITGAGKFVEGEVAARSVSVGSGIATSPIISRNPYGGTDVYVSVSQSTGGPHAAKVNAPTDTGGLNNSLIYWYDRRLQ
jgi:type IV pilus assembly protein PilY1